MTAMTTQTPTVPASTPSTFTPAERRALRALRTRYCEDHDLFTASEMARLRFLRWLAHTGHLVP
jgi:hypothetical protein